MELINGNSEIIRDFFQSMGKNVRRYQPAGKGKQTTFERWKVSKQPGSIQIFESKHPHAARMERYGCYPVHSDKRQNNLPSKRYRTSFADLLQQGTAGMTYRPKKHIFSETD